MNQDQARRMAEELLSEEDLDAIDQSMCGARECYIPFAREAIAAALVKLGEAYKAYPSMCPETETVCSSCTDHCTASSQQEDRKPLSKEKTS